MALGRCVCVQILRWGESQGATDCCSWWSPHTSDGPITWLWHFCPLSSKPTWTSLLRFKTKPNRPPRLDTDLVRDCLQQQPAVCVSGRGRTAAVRSEEAVGGLGSQAGAPPSKQRHRPPACVLSFRASLQTSDRFGTGVCWRESWPVKSNISSYQGLLTTQLHLFQVTCFYLYSHQPRNW